MRIQAEYRKDQIKTEGTHLIWYKLTTDGDDGLRTGDGLFRIN